MKMILTGVAVMRRGRGGLTVYTSWIGDQRLITPMVLTPHMFKRYAERKGVDKHGSELVRHYFLRNAHGCDTKNKRVVARSVRWNGEYHVSNCVNEGVLLGQVVDGIYIARTFITYDMCSGLQQQEFETCREHILTDRELYEAAKKFYSW